MERSTSLRWTTMSCLPQAMSTSEDNMAASMRPRFAFERDWHSDLVGKPQHLISQRKKNSMKPTPLLFTRKKSRNQTFDQSFERICPMSFSSFVAIIMSPLILSFPLMNACVGFSSPRNIFTKSPESSAIVTWASFGEEPEPKLPVN